MNDGYTDQPDPDLSDLQQQEPEEITSPPLLVETIGTVRTAELPSRVSVSRNYAVGTTDPVPLAGRDPRRRKMIVIPGAVDMYFGALEDVKAGTAAIVRANMAAFEVTGMDQIYVKAVSAPGVLSIITENWAD